MYLLDSNIVIYFLNGDSKALAFLGKLRNKNFSISSVSRIEILMGAKKHAGTLEYMRDQLNDYEHIPVDKKLSDFAVDLYLRSKKRLKFKDLIIAATAKLHNMTLITADTDFKNVKGLKVKLFNP